MKSKVIIENGTTRIDLKPKKPIHSNGEGELTEK